MSGFILEPPEGLRTTPEAMVIAHESAVVESSIVIQPLTTIHLPAEHFYTCYCTWVIPASA
jgi:hypothetical protein